MRLLAFVLAFGITTTPIGQAPQPAPPTQQPGQPAPGQPVRMPPRPLRPGETPPKGTAIIRGQVMAATGSPIRRAQVRVLSSDGRGSGGVTSTDSEGRFEVKELVAGRYNVMASKGGFVTAQFGQRRPNEQGTPIEIVDGQTADKVNFSLMRGSVIAGRVLDDGGEPVAGTQVTAMRYAFSAGVRRMMPAGGEGAFDRTDDQGGFRLFGLPPGEYFVSAVSRSGGMITADTNNTEADGFAPTYFPGTANLAEASRITLRAGQEMTGANFSLIVARLAKVRGRALNSQGEPVASAMIALAPADPLSQPSMTFNNTMIGRDGAFQFTNVAPGRYHLNVRPNSLPTSGGEFATMPIVVGNEDIDNLLVTTSLGATARGVIVTDDGSAPAFRPSQVSVMANPAEPMTMMFGNAPSKINDDYSFELSGLSDRRLIRVNAGPGWYLKGVFQGGDDVTDTGVEFVPGRAVDDLQIVVTQKTTELSGLVTDDRNRPVVDATVVIFPANRERWGYLSRYLRTVRPDTEGRYNVRSLPPGDDYLIIAVQNLESGQGGDPEFLARAREEARPLTLNEGETKAVDIKLSKLVP